MLTFAVRSDLVEGVRGHDTEDGVPLYAETFYVLTEDDTGRRWAHEAQFLNATVHVADEGWRFLTYDKGAAEAKAQALADYFNREGVTALNEAEWNETDPAYGSDAWQGLAATGYFRDRERMEDAERY